MIRRFLQFVLSLLLLTAVYGAVQYKSWVAETAASLEAGSEVLATGVGPIEFARSGEGGPTILLVHGTPGGYDQTIRLGRAFNDAGYDVLAVSRPGYLRTPLSVGRTPAQQADAYVALLDALQLERVAILGFSGGGPSALEFAIRHPERCWALVDFMGVSRAPAEDEMGPARQLQGGLATRVMSSNLGAWLLRQVLSASPESVIRSMVPDAANARRILEDQRQRSAFLALARNALTLPEGRREGTHNDMEQLLALETPDLAAIRVPTLVLHGTADINVPLAMAELVAESVVGAEFVTIDGADHFMGMTHTDEVFTPLFGFLDHQRER